MRGVLGSFVVVMFTTTHVCRYINEMQIGSLYGIRPSDLIFFVVFTVFTVISTMVSVCVLHHVVVRHRLSFLVCLCACGESVWCVSPLSVRSDIFCGSHRCVSIICTLYTRYTHIFLHIQTHTYTHKHRSCCGAFVSPTTCSTVRGNFPTAA